MTTLLKEIIAHQIARNGPMDVGTFMALALGHPAHGYYMSRDPFGARGDFITAPEISQMFGELIGAWCADIWVRLGKPEFIWLECGPGRGTLMKDALRATKSVPGFHAAASIHFLEISPVLKDQQAQALNDFEPVWVESLQKLPEGRPIIAVANEFLDALPIRQLQKTKEGWKEIVISVTDKKLVQGLQDFPQDINIDAPDGVIYEFSPAREAWAKELAHVIKKQGGAALLMDYGAENPGFGSSLRAIYKHAPVDFLEHVGEADLSANVDFGGIAKAVRNEDIFVHGPMEQGAFLKNLGIAQRAQVLSAQADMKQKEDIEKALQRLIAPDQMGSLFKVMGFLSDENIAPAGF